MTRPLIATVALAAAAAPASAAVAEPFDDLPYGATSGELLLRLDVAAALGDLARMAPFAAALAAGVGAILVMLCVSSLAGLLERRAYASRRPNVGAVRRPILRLLS